MNYRIATQQDLDYVRDNPYEGAVKDYPYMEIPNENCFTAIFKDEIVAVGGIVIHWPGMAEVWMIITNHCNKNGLYGIVTLGAIREKMEELIKDNNIIRAQATVRIDFPVAKKMIEFLGFQQEGLLRQYCPDRCDAYRYAKIYDRTDQWQEYSKT